jgi:hypothetical protein
MKWTLQRCQEAPQPFLPHRGLDPEVSVGDAERGPFHAPRFELAEKDASGVLGFVEHGLHGQDLPGTGRIDPAGDHDGDRDDPSFDPDFLVQGIDPEEGILFGQGSRLKIGDLRVELLVELRDLAGGDILDAHRMGQSFDLPGRDPVDEGLLNDCDQSLFGSAPLRDEERDIAALADLGHEQIDRSQLGIHPPGPSSGEVGRAILDMLPLGRPDLGFCLDPHHLRHHPLEHRQERIRLRDEL